jgi:hypothetical protein
MTGSARGGPRASIREPPAQTDQWSGADMDIRLNQRIDEDLRALGGMLS